MGNTIYLEGDHNLSLVILSILVSVCTSYTALHQIGRLTMSDKGVIRNYWLIAASIAMGSGIWAMHFIGMLAFNINLDVRYNPLLVVISMLLPIMTSGLAFFLLTRHANKKLLFVSGTILGIGILLMHYIGMEAMVIEADIQYDLFWFSVSVLIALLSANAAVQLFALFRDHPVYNKMWVKLVSAILLGVAISGMHYAGMKAAVFIVEDSYVLNPLQVYSKNNALAVSVGITVLCIQLFIYISRYMDQKTSIKLKESEERYRQLVELSPIAIGIHKYGVFTYINPAGMQLLGAKIKEDVIGKNALSFIHPSYHDIAKERLRTMFENKVPSATLEEKMMRVDGQIFDVEIMGTLITINGETNVQVLFQDITERKKLEEITFRYAFHDTLTGLPNRRMFEESLHKVVRIEPVDASITAVMFIDLDGFKQVNDIHGHDVGDSLLVRVAEKLTNSVRKQDMVARLAGDEFTILLTEIHEEEVVHIAKKIIKALVPPIETKNKTVHVTPSIGISFLDKGENADSLIKKADIAMYQAKQTGKNQYKIYKEE
ncbi:MHYT domain-containing protein [Domibacillus epiphyticus]|uniref:Diguanylate cyclase n=1 Tax=Domibacillus epiphyticus TaxID=1714355 RepID=A0A1V2A5J3_9BACI|nr:diguanylate cyclase [Domibacillus epiphyticus]OMP66289.1 hypothetical protein BTO28_12535 [Domibacillus epiphyticus]